MIPGSASPLLLSSAGGYNLTKSLRFRSSASASLSRTPASASNRTTWTWSAWVKRAEITTTERTFFSAGTDGNNFTALAWINDSLYLQNYTSGTQTITNTTAVFRDPSAWYHIVLAIDTTQGTAANRAKIYVNGVQQAGFSGSPFSSSQQFWINFTYTHRIGSRQLSSADSFSEQYMTEINFVDGQALTPSSFGETSTTTGVWVPKKYSGSYGTNGFYLPFTNTTSTSTLGNDFSGNSNTWTVNNISLTSGTTYDSMNDVPTLTSATTANYCVLNPLDTSVLAMSNGNLQASSSTASWNTTRATVGITSGKFYWEYQTSSNNSAMVGIETQSASLTTYIGNNATGYAYNANDGQKYNNGTGASYGATYGNGDIIGVAFDADAGTLTFYKNNTSQGTAYSSIPTGTYFPSISINASAGAVTNNLNFGQQPFSYTPPTGFVALNTFNLPTPTIGVTASTTANKYFNANLYTGNGTTNAITNVGFQPDLVWVKSRSDAYFHGLYDAVRGAGSTKGLYSNDTVAEGTYSAFQNLVSFDSNGFTLGATSNTNNINANTSTFVGWNWKANGAGSTNTAGSITSTVSANTTAGFSIVTFTSQASGTSTIGHGLGVAPRMVIWKSRTDSTAWVVYHADVGSDKYLNLNNTNATVTNVNVWNNTAPTSTVFSTGSDLANYGNIVAYCFAQVAGYSAFGSYTGNGSTDGTFIYLGFRPRFIMIKRSNSSDPWIIHDTARDIYNGYSVQLYPNSSSAEGGPYSPPILDEVSNGFKLRSSASGTNGSGDTFVYMAFAESPFKYANAR